VHRDAQEVADLPVVEVAVLVDVVVQEVVLSMLVPGEQWDEAAVVLVFQILVVVHLDGVLEHLLLAEEVRLHLVVLINFHLYLVVGAVRHLR
jgi:hypothetical protein